jgi:hypothetical protein
VAANQLADIEYDGTDMLMMGLPPGPVLVGKTAVANAATLDVTGIPSGFSRVECILRDVFPVTAGQPVYFRISQGASFKSDANYSYIGNYTQVGSTSTLSAVGGPGQAQMIVGQNVVGSAGQAIRGSVQVINPITGNPSFIARTPHSDNSGPTFRHYWAEGMYLGATGEIDGIRLLAASGNITGTLEVWGWASP